MHNNDNEQKPPCDAGTDRLLYPSFSVVPLVSRAVLNFHGLLDGGSRQLVRHYDALEQVSKPIFNRRRFGDPDACLSILRHDHYLFSNMRESVESEAHRSYFQLLLDSFDSFQDRLGVGPAEWQAYAHAMRRIEQAQDDVTDEQESAPESLSRAMQAGQRAQVMERLARFLAWPITGGVLPIIERRLCEVEDPFVGGGWLFRLARPLEEGGNGLPDILLNACMLSSGAIGSDERECQNSAVAWSAEDEFPIERSQVEKIVNLLTLCLGLPEALEGDRALFLAVPLFERCEALDTRGGRFFGHLLGWLIYPLIAKDHGEDLLRQIERDPEPMLSFVNDCLRLGNSLASDLLSAIARDSIRGADPERSPVEELGRILPGRLGWKVEEANEDKTDDCCFDPEQGRLVLKVVIDDVPIPYLGLRPWENPLVKHRPLFRPPQAEEHAHVHAVAERVRTILSLLNDKHQSVLAEREKELAKLYFKDLVQLLSRVFLNIMSLMDSDRWEQEPAAQIRQFEQQLNDEAERILEEGYADSGLPRVEFHFGVAGDGQPLLDCCPDYRGLPVRDESRAVTDAWTLLGSLHVTMEDGNSGSRVRLRELFCREVEYLVRFDLPHVVEAVRKTAREGGMYYGRVVKHELGRLVRKLGDCLNQGDESEDGKHRDWVYGLVADRLDTLGRDGKSDFGNSAEGVIDMQEQIESIKWMHGYSEELSRLAGYNRFRSKILFLGGDGDWEVPMSEVAFEAVFTNLWNNAEEMLIVAYRRKIPNGKLRDRVRKVAERAGFYHERFQGSDAPEPRRLGVFWKENDTVALAVLDNAPRLLTFQPDYPDQPPEGHLGMQVLQDVAGALSNMSGVQGVYTPARSLSDDPQLHRLLVDLDDSVLADFSFSNPKDWSVASFKISRVINT